MFYFDTSFIAPLIIYEESSDKIEDLIRSLYKHNLVISGWTRVEFVSLVARYVRMKNITEVDAKKAIGDFEKIIENSFDVITPTASDFDLAMTFLQHYHSGLRAGDAFHLAIAQNNQAEKFYTLDKDFIKSRKLVNFKIHVGI